MTNDMNAQYHELAELAGGFIHEIKNHLSTLGLNLQLLAEDFQDPQTQRERRALTRVQRLHGECQRFLELSNDFLRFARLHSLELVPTDLGKVLEEMIDFFTPTANVANIDIQYLPTDLPPVLLHPDMFKQALLNLMLNAEQAMPQGGKLTIQGADETGGLPLLDGDHSSADGPMVSLCLIDTGKGMPPEMLERDLEPFFSTKQGGTGLGLPTTRKIIEAHGGSIEVASDVDRGSKFTIRLVPPTGLPWRRPPPCLAPNLRRAYEPFPAGQPQWRTTAVSRGEGVRSGPWLPFWRFGLRGAGAFTAASRGCWRTTGNG